MQYSILPKQEYFGLYQKLRYNSLSNTVFVYPLFTQAAYDHNGFYDYYVVIAIKNVSPFQSSIQLEELEQHQAWLAHQSWFFLVIHTSQT